jgi:hypothetical protein
LAAAFASSRAFLSASRIAFLSASRIALAFFLSQGEGPSLPR